MTTEQAAQLQAIYDVSLKTQKIILLQDYIYWDGNNGGSRDAGRESINNLRFSTNGYKTMKFTNMRFYNPNNYWYTNSTFNLVDNLGNVIKTFTMSRPDQGGKIDTGLMTFEINITDLLYIYITCDVYCHAYSQFKFEIGEVCIY